MRLIGRTHHQTIVAPGADKVIASYPLPQDGVLNNVWLEIHVIGEEGVSFLKACMYGISGFVLPVPDPDAATPVDTLWDQLVPKDVLESSGAFDLDTGATDTTPEFEIGVPDISAIFDLQSMEPREIFRRRKLITIASSAIGFEKVDSSVDLFTPVDLVKTQVRKNVRVGMPSMVLFGFSSPATTNTTATAITIPSETQWMLLQFLEVALENAFMWVAGLIETGAETPYEESSQFIADLVETLVFEATAGSWHPTTWTIFTEATFDITVPGLIDIQTLSSE